MPITINGSGSITGITTRLAAAAAPAGSVIQTLSSTKLDKSSTDSTTFVDIPGTDEAGSGSVWEVNITPTASDSKILINWHVHASMASGIFAGGLLLLRGSTEIFKADQDPSYGSRRRVTNHAWTWTTSSNRHLFTFPGTYLDSPGVDTALTYKLQYASFHANKDIVIGAAETSNNNDAHATAPSSITVMEIAV